LQTYDEFDRAKGIELGAPSLRFFLPQGWEAANPDHPTLNPPTKPGAPSFAFFLAKGGKPQSSTSPLSTPQQSRVPHPSPFSWRRVGSHKAQPVHSQPTNKAGCPILRLFPGEGWEATKLNQSTLNPPTKPGAPPSPVVVFPARVGWLVLGQRLTFP
jgi:hypothetical protein